MSCKHVDCVAILNILLTYRLHSVCWLGGSEIECLGSSNATAGMVSGHLKADLKVEVIAFIKLKQW